MNEFTGTHKKRLGLFYEIERAKAWSDMSAGIPVVRVINGWVYLSEPLANGGKNLLRIKAVELHGFIGKLQEAQQAIRVRISNDMADDCRSSK